MLCPFFPLILSNIRTLFTKTSRRLTRLRSAYSAWDGIAQIADIVTPQSTTRDGFLSEAASGAFDGASVAYRTFDSFSITGKVDAELLAALPSSLRFICHNGAGYDQVDVAACTARGIRVSNTPTAVDDATADIGIFLMLGALRNLAVSMTTLRAGQWRGRGTLPELGHDPEGKVLGILGMGGIGRNMAKKARGFGMQIRYYNRTRLAPETELELAAEYVDFETLLRESDVLSLNLPLNVREPALFPFFFCLPLANCLPSSLSRLSSLLSFGGKLTTGLSLTRDTSSQPRNSPR